MEEKKPILCSLSSKELTERRSSLLEKTARFLIESKETEKGFIYFFPVEDDVLNNLFEVIRLESKCCAFLDFKLTLESGNRFVTLELNGADGAKEAIRSLFRWN